MWFVVHNKIDEVRDGKFTERSLIKAEYIIIHRIGKEVGRTYKEVADAFKDQSTKHSAGSYTGGQIPYSFFISDDGGCYQLLEVGELGPHARRWSSAGIGVALSGDFRVEKPTSNQWDTALSLCQILAYWIGPKYKVCGHTELPRASSDPNKECPGNMFNIAGFRAAVGDRLSGMTELDDYGRELVLRSYGVVI